MNTEGIDRLRFAIVEQACKDYSSTCIPYTKKRNESYEEFEKREISRKRILSDCTNFFRSDWFCQLCDLDGENIMRELKKKRLQGKRPYH